MLDKLHSLFQTLQDCILRTSKWIFVIGVICALIGVSHGVFFTEIDQTQGHIYRILYIHAPSSWCAINLYIAAGISSITGLIMHQKRPLLLAKSFLHTGVIFCGLSIITGSIWGKPTWGTYWVWDARLTTMAILFFLYIFASLQDNRDTSLKQMAIFTAIGLVNIPLIKWSVNWWFTLHQPASISILSNEPQSHVHASLLFPLVLSSVGFSCIGIASAFRKFEISLQSLKNNPPKNRITI